MEYDKTHITFSKSLAEEFIDEAMLNKEEQFILFSRMNGLSVKAQATKLNCSEATVHRMIKKIKKKYDTIQKSHPERFPHRRISKQEIWMDNN